MKLALWVLALIAGLGLLLTACGSGGESVDQDSEPASTGTVRSERADRQASIMQRQGQVAAEAERVPDQVGDGEQVDVSSDDGPVAGVTEVGAIDFGHREGLPFLRNSVGDPDAPVVIVEYSDFQWPSCRNFAAQFEPQIIEELVSTGVARYEYRHFIIFGSASQFAAMSTECAGDQGAWWEFHDAYLLKAQARTFTRAGAIELARDEGLNVAQFTQCIDNDEHRDRILQMQQQAIAEGVSGTPTFRINGEPGARSLSGIIDQVHAAAEAAENQEGS